MHQPEHRRRRQAQRVGMRAEKHFRQQIEQRVKQKNGGGKDGDKPNPWPRSQSRSLSSVQPRIKKFARVLPTRIVHRKFSGRSRKPCSNLADGLPARASRRTRSRFNANTPASMPDSRNDAHKHSARNIQVGMLVFIGRTGNIQIQHPTSNIRMIATAHLHWALNVEC